MFILYEDGILISLDFTKIAKKWQGKSWILAMLFSDYNYTFFYIIFVHFITLLVYLKYYRRRITEIEPVRHRHSEINQVIQDIIRLNNLQMAIGNNIQNITGGVNRVVNANDNNNANQDENNTVIDGGSNIVTNAETHANINSIINATINSSVNAQNNTEINTHINSQINPQTNSTTNNQTDPHRIVFDNASNNSRENS